ncbi:MAG TPA: DUF4199 domain-containing protein [Chitinophagaceae bacterium]|nr:DUF4199 domain-containing protein [Chitinophagaceae bacterium]
MQNKVLSSRNGALILLLVLVVFTLLMNIGGFQGNRVLPWLSYIIIVLGIMLLVTKYGKDLNNSVSFGNLFAYGFKTTAILTIFFVAFSVLFYMTFPEYKDQLLEISKQNALKDAPADKREQMEKGMEMFKRFFWVGMIAGILISFAILGALGSVIGAAVAKKNPNAFQDDVNQIGQ